jgi:predicted AAA+ superfamily ATPase
MRRNHTGQFCNVIANYPRLYPPLFYWRTKDGREVDFVIEKGGRFIAFEAKLTGMPSSGIVASR